MGIFSWLFGSDVQDESRPANATRWTVSENGNPTCVIGDRRLTVFEQDSGYKFCVARADRDDRNPYFSESYATEEAARFEAAAFVLGQPSRHKSLTEGRRDDRRQKADARLGEIEARIAKLGADAQSARNLTELRKVEKSAASTAKALTIALSRSTHDGLSAESIAEVERLQAQASALIDRIKALIAQKQRR